MRKFAKKALNAMNYLFAATMLVSHIGGYVSSGIGLLFSWESWKRFSRDSIFAALLVFVAYGLLRTPLSPYPSAGYAAMLGYFSQWLLPFILGYSVTRTKHFRNVSEVFINVFLIILTFSALAYFGFFPKEVGQGNFLVGSDGLLKGLRSHIALAALCVVFSFISLGKALVKGNNTPSEKWLYILLAVYPIGMLVLTGSRGYYIAAAIAYALFGVYWVMKTRNAKVFIFVLVVSLAAGAAAYTFLPDLRHRIQHTGKSDGSVTDRVALYRIALKEIKANPVFGVGPGQGALRKDYFDMLPKNEQPMFHYNHLHSFYLQITAEFGLIGLGLFCWIVWLILSRLFNVMQCGEGFERALAFGVFWGFIGVLFGDIFDTLLRGPGTAMELFWLTGLVLGRERDKAEPR